jgi:PAS domain S-box-containing protein
LRNTSFDVTIREQFAYQLVITVWFQTIHKPPNTGISDQFMGHDPLAAGQKTRMSPPRAHFANEEVFAALVDAMPQVVWSTLPDGYHDFYNRQWYEFTGMPLGSTDGEGWANLFHPDDQPEAWKRWRHSLATGEPYEVEYRLRHHTGVYRWTIGRALPVRDENGQIVRWIGTCTDINDAKRMLEQNELLTRELSHRIKNIFQVIGGLIGLSARQGGAEVKAFASDLRERITALGRAHELVRPHSEESRPAIERTTLKAMLYDLFSPYPAREEGRIFITGDDAVVDDRGATPIALLIHELATNSAKYGALSTEAGDISITIREEADEGIRIVWTERGGPKLAGEPERIGFGTRLVDLAMNQQLGGSVTRNWKPDGLEVVVTVKRTHLSRDPRWRVAGDVSARAVQPPSD